MFDELLNPPPSVVNQTPEAITPIADIIPLGYIDSTGSPSSTTVEQDAPSTSNSPTTTETQSSIIPQDVRDENMDMEVAHMRNDPLFGVPMPEGLYVEGLGHNLFSVGQFCDSDMEVAFRQHSCFIRNLKGVDLLTGSRGNNLYTLSLQDMMASSPICLLSKASKTKSWLWHRRLSHLNFGAINNLARQGLVRGLPKLKFEKDNLYVDDGKISFFLGLQISQSPRGIFINQSKYTLESLKKYGFESCDPVDTPMLEKSKLDEDKKEKAVDPLHYRGSAYRKARTCGKKDLSIPTWNRSSLWYLKDSSVALIAFADVDHTGCQDTRRITSGSVQFLGERFISWSSKRQKSTAISSTEAEYIALSGCCAQILWMRSQLSDHGLAFNKIPIGIFINQSKYALESLKKYGFESCDPVDTPMVEKSKLDEDRKGKAVDPSHYRGMTGTLLYLTASRPDLQFAICMCARIEFLTNKLGIRSFTPETLKKLMNEEDE
uniref:Copia protein n=1 Tax=Tanacetum cinerariifolium TaxID=118510 RepID=A0A6L2MKM9_TANCI|nr:copia protein [Tanacetum cinerariifolium]